MSLVLYLVLFAAAGYGLMLCLQFILLSDEYEENKNEKDNHSADESGSKERSTTDIGE